MILLLYFIDISMIFLQNFIGAKYFHTVVL